MTDATYLSAIMVGVMLWPLTFTWLVFQRQFLSQNREIRR